MTWDGTETRDECYSEPAFADYMRETAILDVCPFKLFPTGTTTVLEGASRAYMRCSLLVGNMGHALEIAQLAEKSASRNDGEAYPKAPDDATQDGDNLMTEELGYLIVRGGQPEQVGEYDRPEGKILQRGRLSELTNHPEGWGRKRPRLASGDDEEE